ncbi:MAG: glycosyltransferase family 39 protein [Rhodospirillaceae bacterium]
MKRDRGLLLAVVAGVLLRLAVPGAAWVQGLGSDKFVFVDGPRYLELAASLAADGRFTTSEGPEIYRPPGYPVLLMASVFAGRPAAMNALVNAALGGLTILLAAWTASRLAGQVAARAAAWCCAVEPTQWIYSGMVYAEPLLAAIVAATAATGAICLHGGRRRWLLLLAVLAALGAYTKIVGYFLPAWIVMVLLVLSRRRGWRRLQDAAIVAVVAAALVGAWHARNLAVAGYPQFAGQMEAFLVYGEAAAAKSEAGGMSLDQARGEEASAVKAREHPLFGTSRGFVPGMQSRFWQRLAASPMAFVRVHARGVGELFAASGADQLFLLLDRREPYALVKWCLRLVYLPVLALAAVGLFWGGSWRARAWLVSLVVYFVLLSSGPFAGSRFRVPVMPVIAVLAGLGVAEARDRYGRLRRLPASPAAEAPGAGGPTIAA